MFIGCLCVCVQCSQVFKKYGEELGRKVCEQKREQGLVEKDKNLDGKLVYLMLMDEKVDEVVTTSSILI